MKSILLILSFALACCLAGTISYKGNVTATSDSDSWTYRRTSLSTWSSSILYGDGAKFTSVSIGKTVNSITGDAMWGEAAAQPAYAPTAWIAFAKRGIYNDSDDWYVNGANGYLANCYVALCEKASNGTVVRWQSLKAAGLATQGLSWDTTDEGASGELKYITLTGSNTGESWKISLTFIVSDVLGVIDYADATVSPKTLESIVAISDWPYKDSSNTLTLVMAVATGSATAKGNVLVSGSDAAQVYFKLASKATVEGSAQNVQISAFASGSFDSTFENQNLMFQAKGVYADKASIKVVNITFPAGAADILYDPTTGAGEPVTTSDSGNTNSAGVVVSSFALLVLACVMAMF